MKEKLYKKLSFGLSLNITLEEYQKIIDNYGNYIKTVYFSLPLGKEFHTRHTVVNEYSDKDAEKKLYAILDLFHQNGIELEVVINQYNISHEKILEAISYLKNNIQVDSICTLDDYIDTIKTNYPNCYFISSFNNLKTSIVDIKNTSHKYNQIVVGKNFMRNRELLKSLKEEGFSCKLLLNNGCSFNCGSCRNGNIACKKVFENNCKKMSPQILYAIQSFFPSELYQLLQITDVVDEFKISSRPCTYQYIDQCLHSYITGKEEKYIKQSNENYYLWGRLGHFIPYYSEFDYQEIKAIKDYLWQKECSSIIMK